MLTRRLFIAASSAALAFRMTAASAEWGKELITWLFNTVKDALPSLDDAYDFLLRAGHDARLLVDGRARLNDVRRRLTDSTPQAHVEIRLEEWLKRYDAWTNMKARQGESDADFAARRERMRVYLQSDWQACKGDAVAALLDIKYLGDELQSLDPKSMPSEEWRAYKRLLDDEKMVIEVINADMPTEPYVIDRLHEVAETLQKIVTRIDERASALDDAIKKAG